MQARSFAGATPLTEGKSISDKMAMFREMERRSASVPKPHSQVLTYLALLVLVHTYKYGHLRRCVPGREGPAFFSAEGRTSSARHA
jgi:hypothetical protein